MKKWIIALTVLAAMFSVQADVVTFTDANFQAATTDLSGPASITHINDRAANVAGGTLTNTFVFNNVDFDSDGTADAISFSILVDSVTHPTTLLMRDVADDYDPRIRNTAEINFTWGGLVTTALSGGGNLSGEVFEWDGFHLTGSGITEIYDVVADGSYLATTNLADFVFADGDASSSFSVSNNTGSSFRVEDLAFNIDFVGTTVTVVPEPATVGMLGLGALATMLFRKLRRG